MISDSQASVYRAGAWEIDLGRQELRAHGEAAPIGGRAFELLAILAQASGQLVARDELMARVWPGAIVEENTLQVHISAIRRALGHDRGMLQTSFGRGYRLLGGWSAVTQATSTPASVDPPETSFKSNIPYGSELVGRAALERHLRDLVSAYRVVMLTGPAGIGKTALAIAVARHFVPIFAGDVLMVELGSVSDPRLAPSAVASALDLHLFGDIATGEPIARAIGKRKLLLVLDNCEHVVDAVAHLTEAIVRICPNTTVLATSREALRIDGEYVYRVAPLDIPPQDEQDDDALLSCSAVQMFIARLRAMRSEFSAGREDLEAIASICRSLDGIPLALEFAAARAVTLGAQQVAARLNDRFQLLTEGRRTALPRHQTLRAALDWSYELLSEEEQRFLSRLGIFAAGFTLEAAAAVAGERGDPVSKTIEQVAKLVAKSLVILDSSSAEPRWHLLQTIRSYALDKLATSGEAGDIARRHAEHYRQLFEEADAKSSTRVKTLSFAGSGREIDNLFAALTWAFGPNGDPKIGVALTLTAIPLWFQLSLMTECSAYTRLALASDGFSPEHADRQRLLLIAALATAATYTQGPGPEVTANWTHTLELAERLGDVDSMLRALWGLWVASHHAGDHWRALRLARRFRWLARNASDPADALVGERMSMVDFHYLGKQAAARRFGERMLSRYATPLYEAHIIRYQFDQRIMGRCTLAQIIWLQGFPDQARLMAEENLADALSRGHVLSVCNALAHAACPIALRNGDDAAAERHIKTLLDLTSRHALRLWRAWGRCFEAGLLIKRQQVEAGVSVFTDALAEFSDTLILPRHLELRGELAEALGQIGRLSEAVATVEDAVGKAKTSGELMCLPELLRIKGDLLARDSPSLVAAEECFRMGIDIARRQGALSHELRSAMSLARLFRRRKDAGAARGILASIYDRFTEGFETADMRQARIMLQASP